LYLFSALVLAAAAAVPASGQAVISTHSGVVHFFEGSVTVAGQPLENQLGRFASVPEGAELRTQRGRAEVLLTPGVFLRIGDDSAIRMLSNTLADTRVELLTGSAMVEAAEVQPDTAVTLIYQGWEARLGAKGMYRLDAEPARFWVEEGKAAVCEGADGFPVAVEQGMDLPLAKVLVPERTTGQPRDTLSDWSNGRSESISADNSIAANIEDPASMSGDPGLTMGMGGMGGGFTYFPMLGLSAYGMGMSPLYGAAAPMQMGFNSIYLPGYTYRPMFMSLRPTGLSRGLYPVSRGGIYSPLTPGYLPPRPAMPITRPMPVHPGALPPGGGVRVAPGGHVGIHR
jgi:hypothetical protein